MPDELPPLSTPRNPYEPVRSVEVPPHIGAPDHELWSNGYPTGADLSDAYTPTSHGNYDPRARYSGNMRHDEFAPSGIAHAGYRGNHGGYSTAGISQYIPIVPSLLRPEYHASAALVPNDMPPSRGHPLHLVAGSSEGNTGPVHPGVSATEDLKRIAGQYLFSPGSHVDKLRMRRNRSGGFKVLITLEIEDEM